MQPCMYCKKLSRMHRRTKEILSIVQAINQAVTYPPPPQRLDNGINAMEWLSFYKYISYAQSGEDVLLYKFLSHVPRGFYVDIGCWDWRLDNVDLFFYERGWSGINIDAQVEHLEGYREHRERDLNLTACLSDVDNQQVMLYLLSGLTSVNAENVERLKRDHHCEFNERQVTTTRFDTLIASLPDSPLPSETHWLKVDVEAHEREVLTGMDFSTFRPWVIMVEATLPNSEIPSHEAFEPMLLEHGYRFFTMSNVNRIYLAEERAEELEANFRSHPLLPFLRYGDYAFLTQNRE